MPLPAKPADFDVDPEAALATADAAVEPAPPPPPEAAELATLKSRQAVYETEIARLKELNERLLLATVSRQPTNQPPPPADKPPDREEDPEAYAGWVADQRIKKALAETVAPVIDAYKRDRELFVRGGVEAAKLRVASTYPAAWEANRADVEAYIANFPDDILARPNAMEEALTRVMGQKALARQLEDAAKEGTNVPVGRLSAPLTSPPATPAKLTDSQTKAALAFGIGSAAEFEELRGPGVLSIDAWQDARDKREAAKKAAGGAKK